MGSLLIFLLISGILYLDVSENGKGTFAKSQTGELLERYGVLKEVQYGIDVVRNTAKYSLDFTSGLLRKGFEGLRPVLQAVEKQANTYIPEVYSYGKAAGNFAYNKTITGFTFAQENIFVGVLSPANLRKVSKDALVTIWTNVNYGVSKVYNAIEKVIKESLKD